jgi:hypothetical protein
LTYDMFYAALEIDLSSILYPQTPLCGYTVTEVFTWTIPAGAPITSSGEKITVWTTDTTKHNTYSVTLTNAITHPVDGTFNPSMTFTVTVQDPCRTVTINTVDVTAGITMKLGNVKTMDFLEATDVVSVATTMADRCGPKSYVVVDPSDSDTPVSWISIAAKAGVAGTYTITASPTDETFVKANNYELWTTLDDYKTAHSHVGRRDALVVTVNTADCDCSEVVRTEPSLS